MSFESFGVPLELMFDDPELEPRVREILPPGWTPSRPGLATTQFALRRTGPDAHEVTIGGVPAAEHAPLEVALTLLDSQMRLTIAANAPGWVFVHAGVVGLEGRALVIPGGSFTGKTTLVWALVQAGAVYYSDEYAVLDAAGLVHAYPRPPSIRSDAGPRVRARLADLIGPPESREPAPIGAVAITRYRAGAQWTPRRVSSGQGLLALLANTVPAQERPEESLRTLRRAVAGANMLAGDRGEAGPAARLLLDQFASATG